jgi:hypothetical protein
MTSNVTVISATAFAEGCRTCHAPHGSGSIGDEVVWEHGLDRRGGQFARSRIASSRDRKVRPETTLSPHMPGREA